MTSNPLLMGIVAMAAMLPLPPATVGQSPPGAPPGGPATRYCLRVDPVIGSRIETVQCMTRDEWADLDVNVDAEWAQNGVGVIGA